MRDDQIRGLLRTLEEDREPNPAFADALFDRLSLVAVDRRRSRAPMLLLAAALLAVLVAGLAVGTGLVQLPLVVDVNASASPSSSAIAVASPSASGAPTPNASAAPSPTADPAFLTGRTLYAAADGLRVRSEPSGAAEVVATVRAGQLMGATGNQATADAMEWYEVRIGPGELRGWVAAGPNDEWLRLVDDGAIAFVCDGCGPRTAVVSVTPFGDSALTTVVDDSVQDVRWSPDGTRLALTVADESGGSVLVMNADGSNRRVVTDNGYGPAWSPDGSRLAWSSGSTLVVTDADLAPTELELEVRSAGNPLWSPDGSHLVFAAIDCPECPPDEPIFGDPPLSIFSVAADGTDLRRLLGGNYDGVSTWSADGTLLAGVRTDLSGEFPVRAFTLPAEGGEPSFLFDGDGVTGGPAFSPDGSRLAAARADGLVVMNPDGSGEQVVATDAETGIWGVVWAPSGRYLLYSTGGSSAGTGLDLWIVPADGSSPAQRVSPEDAAAQMPAWQPVLVPLP